MMGSAKRILHGIDQVEKWITLTAFLVMTLIIIADVVMRKATGLGIIGAPRIAVFSMIITALVSFGLASTNGRHLRPKFLDSWCPPAWEGRLIAAQEYLTAIFCMVFAYIAVGVVYETYLLEETSRMLRLPVWPMQAMIPLVFAIASLRHAFYGYYQTLRPNNTIGEAE